MRVAIMEPLAPPADELCARLMTDHEVLLAPAKGEPPAGLETADCVMWQTWPVDRAFIERLIDRAKAANCSALVLTLDLQILGQRHKDLKNGLSAPPKLTVANIVGVPAATLLGQHLGWQWPYALVAAISAVTVLAIWRWVPWQRSDDTASPAAGAVCVRAISLALLPPGPWTVKRYQ